MTELNNAYNELRRVDRIITRTKQLMKNAQEERSKLLKCIDTLKTNQNEAGSREEQLIQWLQTKSVLTSEPIGIVTTGNDRFVTVRPESEAKWNRKRQVTAGTPRTDLTGETNKRSKKN